MSVVQKQYIIGASLSEPHIDRDKGPHAQNNGMYMYVVFM